ncbi:MAG TPA: CBS domain-containing protein [Vicinamibacteria bacterium]|nr:CBS domain-containing protein [Vicinamibacteria bacterium]
MSKRPTVAKFMTPDPFTLEPEDSLMHALETMRLRSVRRIPVVLGGMLVGLLVEGDLKRAEPSTLSQSQEDFTRVMEGTTISRIMIQDPVTVTAATPLIEAARTLHSTKYGSLPVVEDERVVGILTDNDMLRALIDVLGED